MTEEKYWQFTHESGAGTILPALGLKFPKHGPLKVTDEKVAKELRKLPFVTEVDEKSQPIKKKEAKKKEK